MKETKKEKNLQINRDKENNNIHLVALIVTVTFIAQSKIVKHAKKYANRSNLLLFYLFIYFCHSCCCKLLLFIYYTSTSKFTSRVLNSFFF